MHVHANSTLKFWWFDIDLLHVLLGNVAYAISWCTDLLYMQQANLYIPRQINCKFHDR